MEKELSKEERNERCLAYFSMEVGLESDMPTYSGGLGILAGDTLKAAADLGVPIVGVTLLQRKGYFHQHIDKGGNQSEEPSIWYPEKFLEKQKPRVNITIEGRKVNLQFWKYDVVGTGGYIVPVYFIDTNLPENDPWDQTLTDYLYGGDPRYRLCQEAVLGIGGVKMLKALANNSLATCHMNEGHSALLALGLLEEQLEGRDLTMATKADLNIVRKKCVFTTHTPVPSGHDRFPLELARQVLGDVRFKTLENLGAFHDGRLNMTYLGLFFSHYINGVSMRHEQISKNLYPNYPINSVTNGVHALTWTCSPFRDLFDRYIPEWRADNLYLRYSVSIPVYEVQQAHQMAKIELLTEIKKRTGMELNPSVLTICFARRATMYKRGDMLFQDLDRLRRMVREIGPIQIIYAGKAHPKDEGGKNIIRRVFQASAELGEGVPVVYLEDYDMTIAKFLCAGVDLWLNTPMKPLEASGTSGMKAAMNGVPSLSILDGWWIEGHVEGVTGWSIGEGWEQESDPVRDSLSLYNKLEYIILPMYYGNPLAYGKIMRSVITLNGAFFNAQRMLGQYVKNAYDINNFESDCSNVSKPGS